MTPHAGLTSLRGSVAWHRAEVHEGGWGTHRVREGCLEELEASSWALIGR